MAAPAAAPAEWSVAEQVQLREEAKQLLKVNSHHQTIIQVDDEENDEVYEVEDDVGAEDDPLLLNYIADDDAVAPQVVHQRGPDSDDERVDRLKPGDEVGSSSDEEGESDVSDDEQPNVPQVENAQVAAPQQQAVEDADDAPMPQPRNQEEADRLQHALMTELHKVKVDPHAVPKTFNAVCCRFSLTTMALKTRRSRRSYGPGSVGGVRGTRRLASSIFSVSAKC